MAKPPIDITPIRPNVWVVLIYDDPEGGTIVRRFERFTSTCACEDKAAACRHITAARSLIAQADFADVDEPAQAQRVPTKRARRSTPGSDAPAKETVTITMVPPPLPRKVAVKDGAAVQVARRVAAPTSAEVAA